MYAEIRTDKEILINRLDDSERLLLEEICNNVTSKKFSIKLEILIIKYGSMMDFGFIKG